MFMYSVGMFTVTVVFWVASVASSGDTLRLSLGCLTKKLKHGSRMPGRLTEQSCFRPMITRNKMDASRMVTVSIRGYTTALQ